MVPLAPKNGDRSRRALRQRIPVASRVGVFLRLEQIRIGRFRCAKLGEPEKGDRSMNGSVENDLTPFTVKTSRMLLVVIQDRGWESAKTGTGRDGRDVESALRGQVREHPSGTGQCLAARSLLSKLIKGQEKGRVFFAKSLIWQDALRSPLGPMDPRVFTPVRDVRLEGIQLLIRENSRACPILVFFESRRRLFYSRALNMKRTALSSQRVSPQRRSG